MQNVECIISEVPRTMQNAECIMHNFGSPADLIYIASQEVRYSVIIGLFADGGRLALRDLGALSFARLCRKNGLWASRDFGVLSFARLFADGEL